MFGKENLLWVKEFDVMLIDYGSHLDMWSFGYLFVSRKIGYEMEF